MDVYVTNVKNIRINDNIVPLYLFDDDISFTERVAATLNTIPKYIQLIIIKDLDKENNNDISYLVEDILKNSSTSAPDFILENDILSKYSLTDKDLLDVIKLWVELSDERLNKTFKDQLSIIYDLNDKEIEDRFKIKFNTQRFLTDYLREFKVDYQKEVKANKEKSGKKTEVYNEIISSPSKQSLSFIKEKSTVRFKTNIVDTDKTMNTIFSDISCTKYTPFVSYSVFKLYQDQTTIIPIWKEEAEIEKEYDDPSILLRVHNQISIIPNDTDPDHYSRCIIKFLNGYLWFSIEIDYTVSKTIDIEKLLFARLVESLPSVNILERVETNITGFTIFPKTKFDNSVITDMIMNNSVFSHFIAIDESVKSTKKKVGNCHFFLEGKDNSCNIVSKITKKDDPEIRRISRKILGTMFVRLRLKRVKSNALIERLILVFSKLLSVYDKEKAEVISFYKKFIKNYAASDSLSVDEQKDFTQKDIAPDLFVSDYTRKCTNPPLIVDESSDEKGEEGEKPLLFPLTKEEGAQHLYSCRHHKKHKYIGVIENTLENQDLYRYIPCCFKDNQFQKKSSNPTLEYYKNEAVKKTAQQNILKTNKFSPDREFAYLPEYMENLFVAMDSTLSYLRMGVEDTRQSFLECVLEASNFKEYRQLSKDRKVSLLNAEYQKLSVHPNIAVVSQENPNQLETTIRSSIQTKDVYLDPRKWIRLIEEIYECKIYVFTRDKDEKDVKVMIPNHQFLHLQYDSAPKQTFIIYEHYGSEKFVKYPRCELVIKIKKEDEKEDKKEDKEKYNFMSNETILKQLYKNSNKKYKYEMSSMKIENIKDCNIPEFPIHSQFVDNYGKLRGIYLQEDNIFLYTDPLPPVFKPFYYGDMFKTYPIDSTLKFVEKYSLVIQFQVINKGMLKELSFYNPKHPENIYTVKITPVKNAVKGVEIKTQESYPSISDEIEKVNYMKRLSNVLVQYFIFTYSIWHNRYHKLSPITLQTLSEFRKKNVEIRKVEYQLPQNPTISVHNLQTMGYLSKEGKFMVESKEILKRLVYSLRLHIISNYRSVLEYYSKNEMYNYYENDQYFLKNEQIDNIITKYTELVQKIDNRIENKVNSSKKKYFFKNNMIDSKPVLLIEYDVSTPEKIEEIADRTENGKLKEIRDVLIDCLDLASRSELKRNREEQCKKQYTPKFKRIYTSYMSGIWARKKNVREEGIDKRDLKKISRMSEKIYLYDSSSSIRVYLKHLKDKDSRVDKEHKNILIYKTLNDKKEEEEHLLSICKL